MRSFRAQALHDGLPPTRANSRGARAFGRAVRAYGPGFYGRRERVPFRILGFDGDGRERRALTRDAHISEARPIRQAQGKLWGAQWGGECQKWASRLLCNRRCEGRFHQRIPRLIGVNAVEVVFGTVIRRRGNIQAVVVDQRVAICRRIGRDSLIERRVERGVGEERVVGKVRGKRA